MPQKAGRPTEWEVRAATTTSRISSMSVSENVTSSPKIDATHRTVAAPQSSRRSRTCLPLTPCSKPRRTDPRPPQGKAEDPLPRTASRYVGRRIPRGPSASDNRAFLVTLRPHLMVPKATDHRTPTAPVFPTSSPIRRAAWLRSLTTPDDGFDDKRHGPATKRGVVRRPFRTENNLVNRARCRLKRERTAPVGTALM